MTGTWTEVVSTATCPSCAKDGTSSRLTHYVTADGDLSIFQRRCHLCKRVETHVSDSSPKALAALRKAHRFGRTLIFGVILGEFLAMGMLAAAASVFAATR